MDWGRGRQELCDFGNGGSCSSACHGCLGAEVALNYGDIPILKMWLQGLSVCLSMWEMSVLGRSFGAWDSPGSGQTPGGCSERLL